MCERDGCDRPGRYVDHITPRVLGGSDSLDNLEHLCPHHHGLKTWAENNP
jgi:5-methylcytosine-specific restriction endonuclease McrA